MTFEQFWDAWPKSQRKGAKSLCKAKWDKLKLDTQAEQIIAHVTWMKTTNDWKKEGGTFIPAPLVYINQMRWDGAEVPEITVNLNVAYKDPALVKIEQDSKKAAPMPDHVREMLSKFRKKTELF
jgi:hypothetical protein